MIRDFRALLFFMLLVPRSWSQSAVDLAQKFPHHEIYEVEPGVVMSAKFAPSGLVCEMNVEQTHFDKDVTQFGTGIELDKISALLDRLVPPSQRGEKEQDEFSRLISRFRPDNAKNRYIREYCSVRHVERRKSQEVCDGYQPGCPKDQVAESLVRLVGEVSRLRSLTTPEGF